MRFKHFAPPLFFRHKHLKEFAPSPGYEPEPEDDVPRYLIQYANAWWNAADPKEQEYIEDQMATGGWTIRQIDDDTVVLNHKEYGITYRISDDQFDPDLYEEEDLDEVKMSPSALEKFATSPEAKGIRAGFEAELIFRDTQGEADELDPEPNYDADERCYSIDQVVNFFANDEYGYGLSDRLQNRLMDDLDESYMTWRDEQIISDFRNDAEDLIRDILLEETPMDQRIHFYLTDSLQMSDEEADAVIKAGADAPKFTNSDAQKDYADENPEYKTYLEAADEAEQELEESVEFSVNRQDEYWDEALDKYRDDYSGDDDSFFSDVGLRWMSDVANEYNLDWPVWNMDAGRNEGSRDWETIGALLQDAVDMPVKVSSNYHSTTRREGQWIIEPDGSLNPDDPSDEAGLEIVSPPMPLLTAIEKLRAVTDWANNPKTGNAYTNDSTGLHMGVSLPRVRAEAPDSDVGIDYVKLILFMGDKYVQQQFGRAANMYCASAFEKLRQNLMGKKSDPAGVIQLLRHGLTELAHRELQKGVGTSKYTSAHIQDGYIEFRSPGGDWLAKADEEIGILENTMMRFARAMSIAGNPHEARDEYAKKLYKLVTADNQQYADQLRLFAEFSAGKINKEQLKTQWAKQTLEKDVPSEQLEGDWVVIDANTRMPVTQVYSNVTRGRAMEFGRDSGKLRDDGNYEVVPYNSGKWEIYAYDPDFDEKEQRLEIVDAPNRGRAVDAVYDKYNAEKIPFKVRPYYGAMEPKPEPKLTRRAELAKRIVKPKPRTYGDDDASDWEAVYKPTGRVFDTLAHADAEQALVWRDNVMRSHGFTNVSDILVRRVGQQIQARAGEPQPAGSVGQSADDRADSADIQGRIDPNARMDWRIVRMDNGVTVDTISNETEERARSALRDLERYRNLAAGQLGLQAIRVHDPRIRDIEMDFSHVSDRPQQQTQQPQQQPPQAQQAHDANDVPVWEIYQRDNGHVVHTFSNLQQSSAWTQAQQWLRDIGAEPASWNEFSVRPKMTVAESRLHGQWESIVESMITPVGRLIK